MALKTYWMGFYWVGIRNSRINKKSKGKGESSDLILRHSTIDPLGNVRPCALFPLDYTIGNIFKRGAAVYTNKNLQFLVTMPSPCAKFCANCRALTFCQGCVCKGILQASTTRSCTYHRELSKFHNIFAKV